jgi:hypothetical protein
MMMHTTLTQLRTLKLDREVHYRSDRKLARLLKSARLKSDQK